MPRILLLVPMSQGASQAQLRSLDMSEGDLQVVARAVAGAWSSTGTLHDAMLEDLAVFGAGVVSPEEGFDAVCVHSLSEGGATALRSVLDVPVLQTARTGFLQALTLGLRVGALVESAADAVRLHVALRQWGLDRQCSGVRVVAEDLPSRKEGAQRCVDVDGAEVLCVFSTAPQAELEDMAVHAGCPVVNPAAVTCRMAATFIATGLTHGRVAAPPPIVPKLAVLQAMAHAGQP